MKGSNEMRLNTATMMLALQHYFDTVLFTEGKAPRITGIDKDTSRYDTVFVVKCDEPEKTIGTCPTCNPIAPHRVSLRCEHMQ